MFITFVDFEDKKIAKQCYEAVEVMKEIAPKFSKYFGFFYADNKAFSSRKRVLGITWDELPAMAFNMID